MGARARSGAGRNPRGGWGRFKALIAQVYGKDETGKPVALRHFVTNPAIFIHGDTAKGRIYWFEVANNGPGHTPLIGSYGHYEDEMRKVDGQWKFVSRKIFNEQLDDRLAGPENPVRSAREPLGSNAACPAPCISLASTLSGPTQD